MKLPTKWMEASWVEAFSFTAAVGGGPKQYNTNVIDTPDLYLWIRQNRFPQATPKDYRQALRQMCRDQRPGYKASPLNPELLKMLQDRIASIGKRLWSCQVAELMAEAENPPAAAAAAVALELPTDTIADVASLKRKTSSPSLLVAESASSISRSSPPAPVPAQAAYAGALTLGQAHMPPTGIVQFQTAAGSSSSSSSATVIHQRVHQTLAQLPDTQVEVIKEYAASLGFAGAPLDDALLHHGLLEFGFGTGDPKDDSPEKQRLQQHQQFRQHQPQTGQQQHQLGQHRQLDRHQQFQQPTPAMQRTYLFFEAIESLLPQRMMQAHLTEFNKITPMLRYFQMNDVSARHFKALEQHFTRCFSQPSNVAFMVMKTNRFETGQPDAYANQQAEQLFCVGLTQVQHIIMGVDSTRKVVECLEQAVQRNSAVAHVHVPKVWASTRDTYMNPCPRLVDVWLPRMLFNDNSFIVMIAPHASVSLERAIEVFHAPSDPFFADI